MQVDAATRENGDNHGRYNATGIDNTSTDGGMQSYNAKTGYIEVRFMTGNSKGFNVARDLKQFLAAAREQDNKFTVFPWQVLETTYVLELMSQTPRPALNNMFAIMSI
jgi:hypothetical protein